MIPSSTSHIPTSNAGKRSNVITQLVGEVHVAHTRDVLTGDDRKPLPVYKPNGGAWHASFAVNGGTRDVDYQL